MRAPKGNVYSLIVGLILAALSSVLMLSLRSSREAVSYPSVNGLKLGDSVSRVLKMYGTPRNRANVNFNQPSQMLIYPMETRELQISVLNGKVNSVWGTELDLNGAKLKNGDSRSAVQSVLGHPTEIKRIDSGREGIEIYSYPNISTEVYIDKSGTAQTFFVSL